MRYKSALYTAFATVILLAGLLAEAQTTGFRKMEYFSDPDNIVAESQVWDITCMQGRSGPRVFLATNDGLFAYDGSRLYRSFQSGVNSLRDLVYDCASLRLYSAGNNGFGWWQENEFGIMEYHAVESGEYSARLRDFWKVCISRGGKVFFQSLGRICIYSPESGSIKTIFPSTGFRYMYEIGGDVLVQDGEGLYRISDDGTLGILCTAEDRIMNIVQCGGKRIAALERTGLMLLEDDSLVPLDTESNRILAEAKVMSLAVYDQGRLLVGTTRGGLFITDSDGRILPGANREIRTGNATVLSVAVDTNGDIWMGMEAGVARIDMKSNEYYLEDSRLGRVRGIEPIGNGKYLVGSNKGAFICGNDGVFPVQGTTGSVWSLASYDGIPLIAHDQGLYALVGENRAVPLFTEVGVMSIVRCNKDLDLFICGTYNGLAVFRKEGNHLAFLSYISNYTGFCRHILQDSQDRLWIRDSHKGFIRLTLDMQNKRVTGRKDFEVVRSGDDVVFDIVLQDSLYLCCNSQTYRIDPESENLVRSPEGDRLLSQFGNKYGNPMEDRNASGPFPIGKDCYATGLLGGIRFSYGKQSIRESLYISEVEILGAGKRKNIEISASREEVPFDMNTVLIHLAGNVAVKEIEYRTGARGESWTKARFSEPVQISALPFGNHDIQFRIPGSPETGCTVKLRILRPWYLSRWAISAYILLLVSAALGIREHYRRKARRERERAQLKADLKAQSKELANINFNNAKRNRELNEIKSLLSDRKTVAMIDSYLADESDWEKSEEYFNVIYDGLLEKLKKTYPGISKTDMKICVYTKLNLSTKEIADIMNVSVRSVEMARYRLRKRLGLPPGQDIAQMLKDIPD
ncbi:MAG: sigma-70 family RNA polymerase sigma factor [Bacteroidales bacterium]|nr:sigma-70 family RNA polymerase sigma factor [Bacteroidales bacterium]